MLKPISSDHQYKDWFECPNCLNPVYLTTASTHCAVCDATVFSDGQFNFDYPFGKHTVAPTEDHRQSIDVLSEVVAKLHFERKALLAVARIADEMNFRGFNASSVLRARLKVALDEAKRIPALKSAIEAPHKGE